jgi:hypothetical protein
MTPPQPLFAVVAAPETLHTPDGRDTGCRVGYLEIDADTLADLQTRGFRVLLETEDESAAQALVAERCGTTHGDMFSGSSHSVRRTSQEKESQ